MRIAGWALLGLGGASLATGALFGSGVLLDNPCNAGEATGACADRLRDEGEDPVDAFEDFNDQRNAHVGITIGTLAGGVVLGAGGAVLLLLSGTDSPDAQARSLRLLPAVGPGGAGAQVLWRF